MLLPRNSRRCGTHFTFRWPGESVRTRRRLLLWVISRAPTLCHLVGPAHSRATGLDVLAHHRCNAGPAQCMGYFSGKNNQCTREQTWPGKEQGITKVISSDNPRFLRSVEFGIPKYHECGLRTRSMRTKLAAGQAISDCPRCTDGSTCYRCDCLRWQTYGSRRRRALCTLRRERRVYSSPTGGPAFQERRRLRSTADSKPIACWRRAKRLGLRFVGFRSEEHRQASMGTCNPPGNQRDRNVIYSEPGYACGNGRCRKGAFSCSRAQTQTRRRYPRSFPSPGSTTSSPRGTASR